MAGELIAMYEPDYASEDDIADAPNAVIAPTDSDSEDSDNGSVPTEKRGGGWGSSSKVIVVSGKNEAECKSRRPTDESSENT